MLNGFKRWLGWDTHAGAARLLPAHIKGVIPQQMVVIDQAQLLAAIGKLRKVTPPPAPMIKHGEGDDSSDEDDDGDDDGSGPGGLHGNRKAFDAIRRRYGMTQKEAAAAERDAQGREDKGAANGPTGAGQEVGEKGRDESLARVTHEKRDEDTAVTNETPLGVVPSEGEAPAAPGHGESGGEGAGAQHAAPVDDGVRRVEGGPDGDGDGCDDDDEEIVLIGVPRAPEEGSKPDRENLAEGLEPSGVPEAESLGAADRDDTGASGGGACADVITQLDPIESQQTDPASQEHVANGEGVPSSAPSSLA